jgi:hypothetical protein
MTRSDAVCESMLLLGKVGVCEIPGLVVVGKAEKTSRGKSLDSEVQGSYA